MRRMIGIVAAVMMMMAAGVARAQDASMMAMQAAQQAMDMAMQAAQTANQMAMQQAMMNNDNFSLPMSRPALPMTPRPMISPGGRSFKSGVKVVLYDVDPRAIVFYTVDGSVPTAGSQRYVGPIAVGSKVKVRAMAFDLEEMPSGVVSKTFRVKS
jgi:Chitobiase/beta-hexosaminidase C-terminal domain